MSRITLLLSIIIQVVYGISPAGNQDAEQELVTPSTVTETITDNVTHGNESVVNDALTCSQQCSEQYLSYCTGFSYPLQEDLHLSMSCHTNGLLPRDRYVSRYIDSAIQGQWKNITAVFQALLMRVSPVKEVFPKEYFSPETAVISVLEGHKMSNTCNAQYLPLKELICTWLFVSPCQPHFKICQDSCDSLMAECLPTALRDPLSRPVIDFMCHAMSRNGSDCYLPEDVYREDGTWSTRNDNQSTDYVTILSACAGGAVVLLGIACLIAAVRYYLVSNGYVETNRGNKKDMFVTGPMRDKARDIFNKSDLFPQLRSSSRSLGDKSITSVTFKKRGHERTLCGQQLLEADLSFTSEVSLDQLDAYSLNSSASTFYCQTNQSVSTIGEVLPPETINFEGVLSSRWKSCEDEVIALVSWIDGIGNRKKGVIKCYTDKKRKYMEDELNVISNLSHENICEYLWRSMGNRPHVCGMSPHMQSIMSVRNNYFCTEYYTYGSLKDFLISGGHFLKDTAAQSFMKDIVCGMSYLHELEVFHRDLKTANILVGNKASKTRTPQLRLVISDFGHSQEKHRQDCYVRDGSGGTSQYTAPEVLLSTGSDIIDLYKADVYSMALVAWELLSYVCCKNNEVLHSVRHEMVKLSAHKAVPPDLPRPRCQIQHHTAFGAYLLNQFPDISSTSTSSSVVRDYMRAMYHNNRHFRPAISEAWSSISPTIKSLIVMTHKMWTSDPEERLSTTQLCQIFNLPRFNSRLSLSSLQTKKQNAIKETLSSVLCINGSNT